MAPSADWSRLLRMARSMIAQINADRIIIDQWALGGGTAMMLQINHRESRDIDVFLPDPQLLAFFDPQKIDFAFEIEPSDYFGDGARFVKVAFPDIGEIDFIAGANLSRVSARSFAIEGADTLLESIPEIVTKKIVYRGATIKPRDIFDVAAASERYADEIIAELKAYPDAVAATLSTLDRLNAEFISRVIGQLAIKPRYDDVARTALHRTRELLRTV